MEDDKHYVERVLGNLIKLVKDDQIDVEELVESLEDMLENDCFSTEGQLDPRGDNRDL